MKAKIKKINNGFIFKAMFDDANEMVNHILDRAFKIAYEKEYNYNLALFSFEQVYEGGIVSINKLDDRLIIRVHSFNHSLGKWIIATLTIFINKITSFVKHFTKKAYKAITTFAVESFATFKNLRKCT